MPKKGGALAAFESDLASGQGSAEPSSTEGSSGATASKRKQGRAQTRTRRQAAPRTDAPKRHGERGRERAEDLERVNLTLPADLIARADGLVLEQKRSGRRGYNRSALIQEALEAHLANQQKR